jgi:putative ABC transport system permease protein
VTEAISARPPRPSPTRRSVVLGLGFLVAGIAGVALGVDPNRDHQRLYLFLPGLVCTVVATLLLAAPCLRALARWSGRWPVASRLALRELARYGTRSSAALGAISLGLGIAVATIVIAAAAAPSSAEGNLGSHQIAVWTSDAGGTATPELSAADRRRADEAMDAIRRAVTDEDVVPLQVAVSPDAGGRVGGRKLHETAKVGRRVSPRSIREAGTVFVATPTLLGHLGVDPTSIDSDVYLLTPQRRAAYLIGGRESPFDRGPLARAHVVHLDAPAYTSTPRNLITAAGLRAFGLATERSGWLIETPHKLSDETLSRVRDLAAGAGLEVEVRDGHGALVNIRTGASIAGVIVAMSILAMTIALLRSEVAHEVRTLTAVGGTSFTRRALTASTAAALALVGVVLGGGAAYAALVAGYWPNTDELRPVPVANLVAIAVGFPLLATVISWVVGGHAPAGIGRATE